MKANFLLPPPSVKQASETQIESTALSSRRNFVRKGAATVAALATWDILGGVAQAAGTGCGCKAHGNNGCIWLTSLQAVFDASSAPGSDPSHVSSGMRFTGTLYWTKWSHADDTLFPTQMSAAVFTGGHRAADSAIPPNGNTGCPAGTWMVSSTISTGVAGYPVNTASSNPLRTSIEIHKGTVSEGCIVFGDNTQWEGFMSCMNGNKRKPCVHPDCQPNISMTVNYTV
jgi:hypothetical protein